MENTCASMENDALSRGYPSSLSAFNHSSSFSNCSSINCRQLIAMQNYSCTLANSVPSSRGTVDFPISFHSPCQKSQFHLHLQIHFNMPDRSFEERLWTNGWMKM